MADKTGTVRVFNCTPHPVYLTINGAVIRTPIPAVSPDDGSPGQFGTRQTSASATSDPTPGPSPASTIENYPFARIPADKVDGLAQFADTNVLEVSGDYMKDVTYDVDISRDTYDIFEHLTIYVFNGPAYLVTPGDGKVATPLTPAS
ncbi:hypothetical protein KFU94_39040 [Chloroflexi bacterium TSY]|nr:hypothetical protein [Chloroflexi bacterium TSY]